MGWHPPELIELDDFVLRRSRLDDGERMAVTVAANLDHVRPFMPWASQGSVSAVFQADRAASMVTRSRSVTG